MNITNLKVNHLKTPIGYEFKNPVFSYTIESAENLKAEKTRLIIAEDQDWKKSVYDSGYVKDADSLGWSVPDVVFQPSTRYFWKIEVVTNQEEHVHSETCWFETSMKNEWKAEFISPAFENHINSVLFKKIMVTEPVEKARIYITGLGLYEVWVNRKKCGDEYLTPGFCDYSSEIPYQTYEVEVRQGENLIEVILGNGWYKGVYGLGGGKEIYGSSFSCIAELHIWYQNGEKEVIPTDLSWKCRRSRIISDGIYDGEVYDASIPIDDIRDVVAGQERKEQLRPRINAPVVSNQELKPVQVIHTPAGEIVLDMGQTMTGWITFFSDFSMGTTVKLQFGEILQGGNFYRDNLRNAKAEFQFIADGTEQEVRPHFTYCGFRYVKVTGWPKEVKAEDFTGVVLHTQMERIGYIETSNPMVNQLFSNALWGQKCNFVDIPSDCPQRDGRMGWTGDAQMISGTAMYNFDVFAFYAKYGHDIFVEQKKTGGYVPHVAPLANHEWRGASAAWGDAATIIPWNLYLHYGDRSILENQYDSMKSWVEYIRQEDKKHGDQKLWKCGSHFGDWLSMDSETEGGRMGKTDPYYIASVYYYYSTTILAKTAAVLNKEADTENYQALTKEIKSAFLKQYFTGNGKLCEDTMTAHVLALYFQLVPEGAEKKIEIRLRELLRDNHYRLNTGFVGTPYLCPVLSDHHMNDLAYRLLLNEECPGWLYAVKLGATTIWERWNSVLPDGTVNGTGMNSLNHYSYGSIVEWMYAYMMGLKPVEDAPGFKKAVIAPHPYYDMEWMRGSVATAAGTYRIEWKYMDGQICYTVQVPYGSIAKVCLTDVEGTIVSVKNGNQIPDNFSKCGNEMQMEIHTGTYKFIYKIKEPMREKYSLESSMEELLANSVTAQILQKYMGAVSTIPCAEEVHSLKELLALPFVYLSEDKIQEMNELLLGVS